MSQQTMRAVDPMIGELEMEAQTTRAMLEAVPADKLDWRPHPKSMSLGQLAYHIAGLWGGVSGFLELDELDASQVDFEQQSPESKDQVMSTLEASVDTAKQRLNAMDNEQAMTDWRLHSGGREIFTIPKIAMARSILMNHMYHHRGQLSVYLRLLDIPVPVSYGRTADFDPLR
jgi:uncharacterized damage-inducible protein DinB